MGAAPAAMNPDPPDPAYPLFSTAPPVRPNPLAPFPTREGGSVSGEMPPPSTGEVGGRAAPAAANPDPPDPAHPLFSCTGGPPRGRPATTRYTANPPRETLGARHAVPLRCGPRFVLACAPTTGRARDGCGRDESRPYVRSPCQSSGYAGPGMFSQSGPEMFTQAGPLTFTQGRPEMFTQAGPLWPHIGGPVTGDYWQPSRATRRCNTTRARAP